MHLGIGVVTQRAHTNTGRCQYTIHALQGAGSSLSISADPHERHQEVQITEAADKTLGKTESAQLRALVCEPSHSVAGGWVAGSPLCRIAKSSFSV